MKKKAVWMLLGVVLLLLLGAGALVACLTVWEYRPQDTEEAEIEGNGSERPAAGDTIRVMTFNIGYGALDRNQDFFMDGGEGVLGESRERVLDNLQGIADIIYEKKTDVIFLQEVDRASKRSYEIDEAAFMTAANPQQAMSYAANYRCRYVPYPLPTLGRVESGLVTLNRFARSAAQRIALPSAFSWPVRTAQLKRCLLVERVPLEGSSQELVLVNLHLEAYDDGEARRQQLELLYDLLRAEYAKGNYCIAGGDFNHTFDAAGREAYPITEKGNYMPEALETESLGEGWSFVNDPSTPTCRLLNQPYDEAAETTQYYVIDGFILSPNVKAEAVKTQDAGFVFSDHNPVIVKATLERE